MDRQGLRKNKIVKNSNAFFILEEYTNEFERERKKEKIKRERRGKRKARLHIYYSFPDIYRRYMRSGRVNAKNANDLESGYILDNNIGLTV